MQQDVAAGRGGGSGGRRGGSISSKPGEAGKEGDGLHQDKVSRRGSLAPE